MPTARSCADRNDPEAPASYDWHSTYPAPAKLNLFLHVVGRRADGYHLLQTAFHFIARGDYLSFAPRADGEIRLTKPLPGVRPEDDLTVRAARLLQEERACRRGVDITLTKRLPLGGGLGGGSSDAATVLLALNHLWQLGLSRHRLQQIGLRLGADVPVFVFGRNAFAEGIGERLQAIAVPPRWYVVVEPPVQVPTAVIFGAPELKRDTPAIPAHAWRPGFGGNDLQAVATERFPEIAEHLAYLSALGPARMTGSGACVFAEFGQAEQAGAACRRLPAGVRAWAAAGLEQHPLRMLLADE